MNATTVGVDLAKSRFEVAVADGEFRIQRRARLTRTQFARFFGNCPRSRVVMEACGSAHHWARTLAAQGHEVQLLPAQYVRAYVKRNKTDAAAAGALIEVARCAEIRPVPVKSIDQQTIQQLHRLRSQCMGTRTARINFLRAALREFGVSVPVGARRGISAVRQALGAPEGAVPAVLRPLIEETLAEITTLEERSERIEHERLTRADPTVQQLQQIPGIGLLTATALRGVGERWIDCVPGPCSPSGAVATTKQPSRLPTNSHASCGLPGNISAPSMPTGRCAPSRPEAPSIHTGTAALAVIALMTSGSAAGAAKSLTTLAFKGPSNDWLRAGDSHDVQSPNARAHQQDEYTAAAEFRSLSAPSLQITCRRSPYTLLDCRTRIDSMSELTYSAACGLGR